MKVSFFIFGGYFYYSQCVCDKARRRLASPFSNHRHINKQINQYQTTTAATVTMTARHQPLLGNPR